MRNGTPIYIKWNTVRSLAFSKGMTEQQLLEHAGLNSDLIVQSRYHKRGSLPSTAAKIARVLECNPADIIADHFDDYENGKAACFALDPHKIRIKAYTKGMTEQQLLERAGLNSNQLSIMRRINRPVLASTAAKIAHVLECRPEDLLYEEDAAAIEKMKGGDVNAKD